jgi:transcriptional regulator with XRE-family HTH domain
MDQDDRHRVYMIRSDCAPSVETEGRQTCQPVCVPKQDSWPYAEFIAWLDSVKTQRKLTSDLQLAQFFGINHSLISGWRNRRQRPSIETLTGIANTLGIDPRPLWVLAGQANAADLGLNEDATEELTRDARRPAEFDELLAVYEDPRMTDEDQAFVLRQLHGITLSIEAELNARDGSADTPARRHAV